MSTFRRLREEEDFVDVTLACNGRRNFTAHKVVLSACSPYFKQLLKVRECEQVDRKMAKWGELRIQVAGCRGAFLL